MHRSGTSAVAELLGELGLASPAPDELVPATGANARGHFETKTLVALNERVLATLGGTWSAPPFLAPGWERDPSLDRLRVEADDSFAAVFRRRPAVWKDPRNCILLPFWREVVGAPAAAVLVYRHPLEVARSLATRNGLRLTVGLALWERYVRAASANLVDIPTYCTDFRSVVDDPRAWCGDVVAFLAGAGVPLDRGPLDRATTAVDGALRHQRAGSDEVGAIGDSQRLILEALRAHDGAHDHWRPPDLGSEPPWVEDLLVLQRDLDGLGRAQRTLASTHAYRIALSVHRRRGRTA